MSNSYSRCCVVCNTLVLPRPVCCVTGWLWCDRVVECNARLDFAGGQRWIVTDYGWCWCGAESCCCCCLLGWAVVCRGPQGIVTGRSGIVSLLVRWMAAASWFVSDKVLLPTQFAAKPSNWWVEGGVALSAICAFDRIAGLYNRHLNSNRGIR
jgi:hypothetical protein